MKQYNPLLFQTSINLPKMSHKFLRDIFIEKRHVSLKPYLGERTNKAIINMEFLYPDTINNWKNWFCNYPTVKIFLHSFQHRIILQYLHRNCNGAYFHLLNDANGSRVLTKLAISQFNICGNCNKIRDDK